MLLYTVKFTSQNCSISNGGTKKGKSCGKKLPSRRTPSKIHFLFSIFSLTFFYPITTETITCLILFSDRAAKIRKNYGAYDFQATRLQSRGKNMIQKLK